MSPVYFEIEEFASTRSEEPISCKYQIAPDGQLITKTGPDGKQFEVRSTVLIYSGLKRLARQITGKSTEEAILKTNFPGDNGHIVPITGDAGESFARSEDYVCGDGYYTVQAIYFPVGSEPPAPNDRGCA